MPLKKVTGIVLSGSPLGESDIISTIFTLEEGKESFIFKGLRKSKRRPKNAAEPGSIVEINYYDRENRQYKIASEFDAFETFPNIRKSKDKIFILLFILEVFDRTTLRGNADERLYRFMESALKTLEKTESAAEFTNFFLLHHIKFQGLLPDLEHCLNCGKPQTSRMVLCNNNIVVECKECSTLGQASLDTEALAVLKLYCKNRFSKLVKKEKSPNLHRGIFSFLTLFMEEYYSLELKSKSLAMNIFNMKESSM